jgi:hypothetical protein
LVELRGLKEGFVEWKRSGLGLRNVRRGGRGFRRIKDMFLFLFLVFQRMREWEWNYMSIFRGKKTVRQEGRIYRFIILLIF